VNMTSELTSLERTTQRAALPETVPPERYAWRTGCLSPEAYAGACTDCHHRNPNAKPATVGHSPFDGGT